MTLPKEVDNPTYTDGSHRKLDIYHEETFYNENLKSHAPDFIGTTSLACCPGI